MAKLRRDLEEAALNHESTLSNLRKKQAMIHMFIENI